jgi:hypothetical protein
MEFEMKHPVVLQKLSYFARIFVSVMIVTTGEILTSKGHAMASQNTPPGTSPLPQSQVPPARPGHFAELEELNGARKRGTRAAYDLFLARHPGSRYAADAIRERAALPVE